MAETKTSPIKGVVLIDGAKRAHTFPLPEGAAGWLVLKAYFKAGLFGELILEPKGARFVCMDDAAVAEAGRQAPPLFPVRLSEQLMEAAADGE